MFVRYKLYFWLRHKFILILNFVCRLSLSVTDFVGVLGDLVSIPSENVDYCSILSFVIGSNMNLLVCRSVRGPAFLHFVYGFPARDVYKFLIAYVCVLSIFGNCLVCDSGNISKIWLASDSTSFTRTLRSLRLCLRRRY